MENNACQSPDSCQRKSAIRLAIGIAIALALVVASKVAAM